MSVKVERGGQGRTFDIRDGVEDPSGCQNVCVFSQQCRSTKATSVCGRSERDAATYVMIRALCLLRLKCGSGKRKNIFVNCGEEAVSACRRT